MRNRQIVTVQRRNVLLDKYTVYINIHVRIYCTPPYIFFRAVLFASWRVGSTLVIWLFLFAFCVLLFKCLRGVLRSLAEALEEALGQSDQVRRIGPQQQQQLQQQRSVLQGSHHQLWRPGNLGRSAQVSIPHLCALSCICYKFQPLNFQFPSTPLRTRSPTPLADPSSRLRLRRQARTFPLDTRTIAARESPPCLLVPSLSPPPHLRLPPSRPPPAASAFLIQILLRLCSTHRTEARYNECL